MPKCQVYVNNDIIKEGFKGEKCGGKTRKDGMYYSNYHSNLRDHKLGMQGHTCK